MTLHSIRWTFVVAAAATAPLFVSASASALDCTMDSDCPEGEVCLATPCAAPDCDPSDPACEMPECPSICSQASVTGIPEEGCTTNADCGEGFECIVESGEACSSAPCAPGEACDEEPVCEPYEYSYCAYDLQECATDTDCTDGFVCYSYSYESCVGNDLPCASEGECPEPEPAVCETIEEAYCVPPYVAPCEVDADCGDGFACVEAQSCGCGGSGGTDAPPVPGEDGGSSGSSDGSEGEPGDAGTPDEPGDRDVPEDDCGCEPAGEFYCEPQVVECATDSDCPAEWTCSEMGVAPAPCYYDEDTDETVCDEPTDEGTLYCMPPDWGFWGGGAGSPDGGYEDSLAEATGGEPRSTDDAEGGGGTPEPEPNGADDGTAEEKAGCSAASAAGLAPAFGMFGLVAFFRRRRKA